MNYLAHYYLAQEDPGLIVGNLLADHYKGKKYLDLPDSYRRGVLLHRKIDHFTDEHPEVEKTKSRLRTKYRKYAPVISDVYYDYFLGSNWPDYSAEELKDFTSRIYDTLNDHHHALPEAARTTLGWMSHHDWLYHYSSFFGIEKALQGLSRRTSFENNMDEAIEDLKRDKELISEEFKAFFDDIRTYVSNEIPKL
jgi:acyl carrier protein phosphodiesterase